MPFIATLQERQQMFDTVHWVLGTQ